MDNNTTREIKITLKILKGITLKAQVHTQVTRNKVHPTTTVHLVNDTEERKTERENNGILHSSSQIRGNVLLKTAVTPVWSERNC